MNNFDEKYWSNRYLAGETKWDIGSISTPLKTYFDSLTNKTIRILIPGAGNAYEAEYLLENGFSDVTILDISPEPLKNIKKRIPVFPSSKLICGDFFTHSGEYDQIIEQTFFCSFPRELRSRYALQMHSLLAAGGRLTGVLFDADFNNNAPPFGGNKEEYIQYFEPYFKFKTFENCHNSIKPRANKEIFIDLVKK